MVCHKSKKWSFCIKIYCRSRRFFKMNLFWAPWWANWCQAIYYLIVLQHKSLKSCESWWRMKDEWWMMKDKDGGIVVWLIFCCLRGFEDGQTNGQMDICQCRVSFATDNLSGLRILYPTQLLEKAPFSLITHRAKPVDRLLQPDSWSSRPTGLALCVYHITFEPFRGKLWNMYD